MSVPLLSKIQLAARTLKGQPPAIQVRLLRQWTEMIQTALQSPDKRHKKIMERIHNHADSLADGLASGDASSGDINAFAQDVIDAITEATNEDLDEQTRRETKMIEGNDPDNKGVMPDNLAAVLKKYNEYSILIPKRLPKPTFKVYRSPVIPITSPGQPGMDMVKLKHAGLAQDSISYYPIILNQRVLGFDIDWVLDNYMDAKSRRRLDRAPDEEVVKAKRADHGEAVQRAINDVIERLQAKFGQTFVTIGQPLKRDHVLWVWIAPGREASRLAKCAVNGHLMVGRWGFPFKQDQATWKAGPRIKPRPPQVIKPGKGVAA